MNKRDYMNNILALCADTQKELYGRMYPDGPTNKQLDHAIWQIENTLKDSNDKRVVAQKKLKLLEENQEEIKKELGKVNQKNDTLEKENKGLYREIEALSSNENIEKAKVIEDLNLLEALRAAGVDNWDGWDYAIEILNQ